MNGARRAVGLVLAAVLLVGVVAAVVVSRRGSGPGEGSGDLTVLRGIAGSEKKPFFDDPAVVKALADAGYRVEVDYAGSRDIVDRVNKDPKAYDFAFPSGAPQGNRIAEDTRGRSYVPFFSPMAIGTFQKLADLLVANNLAKKIGDSYYQLDMARYLDLVEQSRRWSQLDGNTVFPTDKSVLITSTDLRTSNSAAMYLALLSYVANKNDIVADSATADAIAGQLAPAFTKQGYTESSSEGPFEDYLRGGMGARPMVMIYEAQFLAAQAAKTTAPDMVLMYPSPTAYSKHTLVGLSAGGQALGDLLTGNATLLKLAAHHGFRTDDRSYVSAFARENRIPEPPELVDVVDPPTYELMEKMITDIAGPARS
ncbi:hypothetical protein Ga0074812_13341 [Parafrankia irregularis]|uniref:Extracellular solute-binding protein n=1 Tax=Parafrankia irregularis TaxID=795642 RepID=A0A0S4QWL7_9ACTN|nr:MULTISPECIES: hypothetical protein [Parafrankia]MBE3206467.1 hypothetical protein [Parafrankia sp. CH37]CUU59917.1 hypothetical protein Ga0074812_13341 [Parafrankia irregularis]